MATQEFENSDRKMSDLELIKKTWKYISPFKFKFILALFLMGIMILLDLVTPLITEEILLSLTINQDPVTGLNIAIDIQRVFLIAGLFFVTALTHSTLIYFNAMLLQKVGQNAIYQLRMIVFEHIESLSLNQLNNIPVGSLVTRVTSDTNALCDLFTNTIVNLIKNIFTLIAVVIVIYIKNWMMASVIFAFVPIIFVSTVIFRKYSRANYRIVRKNFSIMNAFLNENIS